MSPATHGSQSDDVSWVRYCGKLARQLQTNRISLSEYAHGLTLAVVSAPDELMSQCIETMPAGVLPLYADFLTSFLIPTEFMPTPRPFLAGDYSEIDAQATQTKLKPKYSRLYEAIQQRVRSEQ